MMYQLPMLCHQTEKFYSYLSRKEVTQNSSAPSQTQKQIIKHTNAVGTQPFPLLALVLPLPDLKKAKRSFTRHLQYASFLIRSSLYQVSLSKAFSFLAINNLSSATEQKWLFSCPLSIVVVQMHFFLDLYHKN